MARLAAGELAGERRHKQLVLVGVCGQHHVLHLPDLLHQFNALPVQQLQELCCDCLLGCVSACLLISRRHIVRLMTKGMMPS